LIFIAKWIPNISQQKEQMDFLAESFANVIDVLNFSHSTMMMMNETKRKCSLKEAKKLIISSNLPAYTQNIPINFRMKN
jgi:hypothetical protein